MKNISRLLPIIFLVCVFAFILIVNATKPRLLVLHSNDKEDEAVLEINKGLKNIFGDQKYLNVEWSYIPQEKNPAKMQRIEKTTESFIESLRPSVLLLIGDEAQKMGRKYLNNSNMRLIFSGTLEQYQKYGYQNATNVVASIESEPFLFFHKVLLDLFPSYNRLVFLSDNSLTSKNRSQEFIKTNWTPFRVLKVINTNNFQTWMQTVALANKTSDLLLVDDYRTLFDENKKAIEPKNVLQWTLDHSTIPVMSFHGDFVHDGGSFAIEIDEEEQGKLLAELALSSISKDTNKKLVINDIFVPYIRESAFKKEFPKTTLPPIYLSFSKSADAYYP